MSGLNNLGKLGIDLYDIVVDFSKKQKAIALDVTSGLAFTIGGIFYDAFIRSGFATNIFPPRGIANLETPAMLLLQAAETLFDIYGHAGNKKGIAKVWYQTKRVGIPIGFVSAAAFSLFSSYHSAYKFQTLADLGFLTAFYLQHYKHRMFYGDEFDLNRKDLKYVARKISKIGKKLENKN